MAICLKYFFGITCAGLYLLTTTAVWAQTSSRNLLLKGMGILEEGANHMDLDKILEARTILESIPEEDSLAFWAHYYAGAASSDMANMIREQGMSGRRKEVLSHLNNAIAHLETTVKERPDFAEGWVLLSTAYVHKITVKPLRAMTLGRKFNRAMSKAVELEPNNPRVKLVKGITEYALPGIVGGDKELAEKEFNEAALLFAEEVIEDPLLPSWGHEHAYARLGIVYMDRGDLEDARRAFEQALSINPEFGWVQKVLIPALEEKNLER